MAIDSVEELEKEIENMDMVMQNNLFFSVKNLNLSLRARNALERVKIEFVGDWIFRTQNARKSIPGLGNMLFNEIEEEMRQFHILDISILEEKIKNSEVHCISKYELLNKFLIKKEQLRQKYVIILEQKRKLEGEKILKQEQVRLEILLKLESENLEEIDDINISTEDINKLAMSIEDLEIKPEVVSFFQSNNIYTVKDWILLEEEKRKKIYEVQPILTDVMENRINELNITCVNQIREIIKLLESRKKQKEEEEKRIEEERKAEEISKQYEDEMRLYQLAQRKIELEEKMKRARETFERLQKSYDDKSE